jgi:hypothetical protein
MLREVCWNGTTHTATAQWYNTNAKWNQVIEIIARAPAEHSKPSSWSDATAGVTSSHSVMKALQSELNPTALQAAKSMQYNLTASQELSSCFYENIRFITASHWSISWASQTQSEFLQIPLNGSFSFTPTCLTCHLPWGFSSTFL